MVTKQSQLPQAIKSAFEFSEDVIVEEFIKGSEFSVGVFGHSTQPTALPVTMIKTKKGFFDFEAKYKHGVTEEICPAPVSQRFSKKLQQTAIKAYQAVKGDSHSRIDMIVSKGNIFVLEINTFPGLTSSSIFPKQLTAAGITLSDFLDSAIVEKLQSTKARAARLPR